MVGPSIDDERRATLNTRLQASVVLLVAVSGATVALQAGGTPFTVAGGGTVGGLVGYAAVRYLAVLGRQARVSERSGAARERSFGADDGETETTTAGRDGDESERRPRQRP